MEEDIRTLTAGTWCYSLDHGQRCQVIETEALWGETTCRIWLPGRDSVVRVPASRLKSLDSADTGSSAEIAYVAAAARVTSALWQDVLLAPIESSVIPLPHQIRALRRAVSGDRVRYLLADEVGLGKTIEAGLIMRELKLRGLARRVLVIAPRGLVTQWVSEMRMHFGEHLELILPEDLRTLERFSRAPATGRGDSARVLPSGATDAGPWSLFPQVVCPMDSVKPLDRRRGWSKERVAEYNRSHFEELVSAGWDLVIVDESHRLGGSTDEIARYQLGRGLADAAPYLLLLSATPHQGKSDGFHRLLSLLDPLAFANETTLNRSLVKSYVIRTEKRRAIDARGQPLFKPRQTELVPIGWEARHREQRLLYEAVTDYVREGYNRAVAEKKSYIGFLMILMQRLITSSTRAISSTLERRLEALSPGNDIADSLCGPGDARPEIEEVKVETLYEMDGEEQIETLVDARMTALENERSEVALLLQAARKAQTLGPDVKTEALLDWIYRLQQEESDPDLKALVFTEFVPTQQMLHEFLSSRGIISVCLNGSMSMEERGRVQEAFAGEARVLISTDAGGEGLNLQFCHVVVNYDMPWNPMRLEQRIGRVDRIGQSRPVRALNFSLEDTVEFRVREVLEEKLAVILAEFGVDKTGDVLDSALAGRIFDDLYMESIRDPENFRKKVESVVSQVEGQAKSAHEAASVLGGEEELDPFDAQRIMDHPMPHWVERMTVSYLQSHGGAAERRAGVWDLIWPTGETSGAVVFTARQAEKNPTARHLTLEDAHIRDIATHLPVFAPGQPVPRLSLSGLPSDVIGFWSLWRITLHTRNGERQRVLPLFLHDDGRALAPTARRIWDELLSDPCEVIQYVTGDQALAALTHSRQAAQTYGEPTYSELYHSYQDGLAREREKGEQSFIARRRVLEQIGQLGVRARRLAALEQEERLWRDKLRERSEVQPGLTPLLVLRIGAISA